MFSTPSVTDDQLQAMWRACSEVATQPDARQACRRLAERLSEILHAARAGLPSRRLALEIMSAPAIAIDIIRRPRSARSTRPATSSTAPTRSSSAQKAPPGRPSRSTKTCRHSRCCCCLATGPAAAPRSGCLASPRPRRSRSGWPRPGTPPGQTSCSLPPCTPSPSKLTQLSGDRTPPPVHRRHGRADDGRAVGRPVDVPSP